MNTASIKRASKIKQLLTVAVVIVILIGSGFISEVNLKALWDGRANLIDLFYEMFPPDWSYFTSITKPMLETIRMAVLGTTFGGIVAIPVALLSSSNVVKIPVVYHIARIIMNLIRTIPELLLAALFVPVFGIGEVSGIIAIAVFSFGIIGKLLYEAIEAIDQGPLEAMTAVGANKVQWIFFGVIPQITAHYMSFFLYSFEINIRAAAILGYVGAGGIGLILNSSLGFFQYDRVCTIIIYTLIVCVIVDAVSNKIREKLL